MNTVLAITSVVTGSVILGGFPIGLVLYWRRLDRDNEELMEMALRHRRDVEHEATEQWCESEMRHG